jgi:hypothetical protein
MTGIFTRLPAFRILVSGGALSLLVWPAGVALMGVVEYVVALPAMVMVALAGGYWTAAGFRRRSSPRSMSWLDAATAAIASMLLAALVLLPVAFLAEFILIVAIDPTHGR